MPANPQNLRVPTSEEARINGSKGGKKSVLVRERKRAMKDLCNDILTMALRNDTLSEMETIEQVQKLANQGTLSLTVQEVAVMAIAARAVKGDIEALKFLRDTSGQAPTTGVEDAGSEDSAKLLDKVIKSLPAPKLGSDTNDND